MDYLNCRGTNTINILNVNDTDNDGCTALFHATRNGDLTTVQHLIDHGADVNLINQYDASVLLIACKSGSLEIVQCLVSNSAFINYVDCYGYTALLIACKYGHIEIVKFLISHGANIQVVTVEGDNIFSVCQHGHFEILKYILYVSSRGVDITLSWLSGDNLLWIAVSNGNLEMVNFLFCICYCTDATKIIKDGKSVVIIAAELGHLGIVDYLCRTIPDINVLRRKLYGYGAVQKELAIVRRVQIAWIWSNRRNFLLFLHSYQLLELYNEPCPVYSTITSRLIGEAENSCRCNRRKANVREDVFSQLPLVRIICNYITGK